MRCRKSWIWKSGAKASPGSRSTRAAFRRSLWSAPGKAGKKTGTKITFRPDPTIMEAMEFNYDTLSQRLRELAFLNKGLKITLTDERVEPEKRTEFIYNGGIAEFIKHLNRGKAVLHDNPIYVEGEKPGPSGTVGHRNRAAVQRWLRRDAVQLRQQHQHGGWRHASAADSAAR